MQFNLSNRLHHRRVIMRTVFSLLFDVAVVIGSAILLHTTLGPLGDGGLHVGIYAAVWVCVTTWSLKYQERRRLFTYFIHQGYTEKAADEGVARILGIRHFAKRTQPKLDKEHAEYERLRKKFDPQPPG